MAEAIAITGVGVISPIGNSVLEFQKALLKGQSGRKPLKRFDISDPGYQSKWAATIDDEFLDEAFDPIYLAGVALKSAQEAVEISKIDLSRYNPYRIGIILGTSHGSNHALIRFLKQKEGMLPGPPDYLLLQNSSAHISAMLADHFNIKGPSQVVSTACSSGTTSIGLGMDLLRSGYVDVVLAGGTDIFSELTFSGFNCLKAMTPDLIRPLSKDRNGLMLGEGAAIFVMERQSDARKRKAKILGELMGYSVMNEAYHETAPHPEGENAYLVMKQALEEAGISAAEIDYINVHGTGTESNDIMELKAIRRLFGPYLRSIKVSATKSMIGHALGAAGSLELAATVLCMQVDHVPPTINFTEPIEGFEQIDTVPHVAQPFHIRYALSNSFAFAGHLSAIVVKNPKFKGGVSHE